MTRKGGSNPLRIMHVEDDEHEAIAFNRAFKQADYDTDITHMTRAEETIDLLKTDKNSFDVIVSDFKLPGMNGLEMCKKLLQQEIHLPMVIMTGTGSEKIAIEALKSGVYDYILKDPSQGYLELLPMVIEEAVKKHADKTARIKAEDALQKAHAELEERVERRTRQLAYEVKQREQAEMKATEIARLPEESPSPVMRFDRNGILLYANASSTDVIKSLNCIVGEQADEDWCQILMDVFNDNKSKEIERKCAGALFSFLLMPVIEDEYLNVYGRDVTENYKAELAMIEAKESAEAANRAKSEFLANISHELRTPLNAIIGFSDLMKTETFGPLGNEKYNEYANSINYSGEHLLDIIHDILDVSRIETGKMEFSPEQINITPEIESCLRLIKERAKDSGLSLCWNIADDIPTFNAEPRRIKQIILNLLSNAVKFTPKGGSIDLQAYHDVKTDEIVLTIADTGIGMNNEDIPNMLTPFSQVDSQLDRKYEGLGLGLPLTNSLIKLHKGTLDIKSELGKGTLVTVRLPLKHNATNGKSDYAI